MKETEGKSPLWEEFNPITSLASAALLVLATTHLSHALLVFAALLFVNSFSTLVLLGLSPILPNRGLSLIAAFVASFFAYSFHLLLSMVSPVLALELGFIFALIPLFFMASTSIFMGSPTLVVAFARSAYEAVLVGVLLIAFALVREILAYGYLTLPGLEGAVILFGSVQENASRAISSSVGALILLAYLIMFSKFLRSSIVKGRSHKDEQ
ncbi:hypothetical protein MASR2M78_01630 [Treponema sp.]